MGSVSTKIRVRYNECDVTGFAFNGNYFIWMQEGATDLFEAAGVNLVDLAENTETMMAVYLSCDYKRPVRFREMIEVRSTVEKVGESSLHLQYDIYHGEKLLAIGRTVHASVNIKTKKNVPIPEEMKEKFLAFQTN